MQPPPRVPFPRAAKRRRQRSVLPALAVLEPRPLLSSAAADVLTYHNDNARTGQDLHETVLTPADVNPSSFGRLFTDPVDGAIYAQPLYLANVTVPGQGTHNVVVVATEHDSVYAFDADAPGAPLWQDSFINPAAGVTSVPALSPHQGDLYPEIGITGTPVIDPSTGTLYVVAETLVTTSAGAQDVFTLHALDVATGAEKDGGPHAIAAMVRGRGTGQAPGGTIPFRAQFEIQRPALLLDNGVVYAAFGSLQDYGPFHGWVLGFNARTLHPVAQFNDTPDGSEGGIWMSGGGLAADRSGKIYLLTGNGTFSAVNHGRDYGDSFLELSRALHPVDYFTPSDQTYLSANDLDVGSGGPLLAPAVPGDRRTVIIGGGKEGTLYVVRANAMGHFRPTVNSGVQTLTNLHHPYFSTPAYFDGTVYVHGVNDGLTQYQLVNGRLVGPVAQSSITYDYPGATPSISANGATDGIVWEIQKNSPGKLPGPAVLHAYAAQNVAVELYNSDDDPARDQAGSAVKFAVPTVANGKVYVDTQTGLVVYGLIGTSA